MKKEIKRVKKGVIQITTQDERWYIKGINELDETQPIDLNLFYPSVTWICGYYPKGIAYHKWLASKGWDEAESIKVAAGDKGSKVHLAVNDLIRGVEVTMEAKYPNHTTGKVEELTIEEWECLMSFVDWVNEAKPVFLDSEIVVFNEKYPYAGTVDIRCKLKNNTILDIKTGQYIWPSHELQVSAYKHAKFEWADDDLAILQLGYKKNKRRWKFTPIKDKFNLFLAAREIWQEECAGVCPLQKDYPTILKLNDLPKV